MNLAIFLSCPFLLLSKVLGGSACGRVVATPGETGASPPSPLQICFHSKAGKHVSPQQESKAKPTFLLMFYSPYAGIITGVWQSAAVTVTNKTLWVSQTPRNTVIDACTCHRCTYLPSTHAPAIDACVCQRPMHLPATHTPASDACTCQRRMHLSSTRVPVIDTCACHQCTHLSSMHAPVVDAHTWHRHMHLSSMHAVVHAPANPLIYPLSIRVLQLCTKHRTGYGEKNY